MTPELSWQKSSYCGTNACVEVARSAGAVLVRDSKRPDIAPLAFSAEEFDAFVRGVKADEFS